METHRDTPLARFTAFWWGIGLFFLFTILLLFAIPSLKKEVTTLDDVEAEARAERRAEIDQKQSAYFEIKKAGSSAQVQPTVVFSSVGKTLLAGEPSPVQGQQNVLPGSPTAEALLKQQPQQTEQPAE